MWSDAFNLSILWALQARTSQRQVAGLAVRRRPQKGIPGRETVDSENRAAEKNLTAPPISLTAKRSFVFQRSVLSSQI